MLVAGTSGTDIVRRWSPLFTFWVYKRIPTLLEMLTRYSLGFNLSEPVALI